MDLSKKYRYTLIGFVIMLLLNIIVLGSIWWVRWDHSSDRRDWNRSQSHNFIARELELTDQQMKQYRKLRKTHFTETRGLVTKMRNDRRALFSMIGHQEIDTTRAQVDSLIIQLGNHHRQLYRSIYAHFRDLRNLCTPDQKKKLDNLMDEIMRHMGPDHDRARRPSPGVGLPLRSH